MRISGTGSSSVILSHRKKFKKLENGVPKVPKQSKIKRNGVLTHKIINSINFKTDNFDALKRYESTEGDRRIWLHVPSGTRVWGQQMLIILTSYILEVISQSPYSHYMDPVSYDFTSNFGKMSLLVPLLMYLLTTGEIAKHVIHGIQGILLPRFQIDRNVA